MIVAAKAVPGQDIQHKVDMGFKYIEVQLLKSVVTEEDYQDIISHNVEVLSVHTPLIEGVGEVSVEHLLNQNYYRMLYNTCYLAQRFAEYYGHDVNVVVHNGLSRSTWRDLAEFKERIGYVFETLLEKFPDIYFCFENSSAVCSDGCWPEDAEYIVDFLNDTVARRFAIVIDTCHLLINNKIFEEVRKEASSTKSLDECFNEACGYTRIVHLSNIRDFGYAEGHGVAFDKDSIRDMRTLDFIIEAHQKYCDNAIVCLEVREEDYSNCINLKKTYEALEIVAKKQGFDIER